MTERRKQNRERRHNIAVGATAFLALVGLGFLLFSFGYLPGFLDSGYRVTLELDNAAGLHDSSRVTLAGYQVGMVEKVELVSPGPGGPTRARVSMRIRDEVDIPENISVRIETPIFGGGPTIVLMPTGPGTATLPKDGTAQLPGASVVNALMQLEVVSTDISELKEAWVEVGGHLNAMFEEDADSNSPNLPRVVMALEERLVQMERVLDGAEQWTGNAQLLDDVTQTAENLRELSETLDERVAGLEERYTQLADEMSLLLADAGETVEHADDALAQAEKSIVTLETRMVALADDAALTMSSIDALVAQASSEDSTLGLLLTNPSLYENLDDTAERLQLLVDEARLLIAKWKAEGLPLNVFD